MVPIVETARLTLRQFRSGDFPRVAAMFSDEAVVRFLGGTILPREEAWRRMLSSVGLWALLGYGYWGVARRSDDAVIGIAGFADFKRDLTPSIEGLPEMGWIFAPEAHGQGFATEAVTAGLGWIDAAMPGVEVPAIIDPENGPSIRVAERCGFTSREDASYRGSPILLFRRPPGSPAAASAAAPTAA